MNVGHYTDKARDALAVAQETAEEQHNPQLEPEHLLLALVRQPGGVVPRVLERLGADPAVVARQLEQAIGQLPKMTGGGTQLSVSPRMRETRATPERRAGAPETRVPLESPLVLS